MSIQIQKRPKLVNTNASINQEATPPPRLCTACGQLMRAEPCDGLTSDAFGEFTDGGWTLCLPTGMAKLSSWWSSVLGYGKTGDANAEVYWEQLVHADDLPCCREIMEDCLANRRSSCRLEFRLLSQSGHYHWILCRGQVIERDDDGRAVRMAGTFIDISPQKRAQAALQSNERKYRQLFAEMISGFALHEIILDGTGKACDYRFLAVNPAFEAMTGLKASDLVGRRVLEIMPNTETVWIERYGEVALTARHDQFEQFSQALGKYFEVRAYCPELGQFATIFNDVTERRQAEQQRLEMERHLLHTQKLESLGLLAGGVAHDFNNLLLAILGNVELAQLEIGAGHHAQELLQQATAAALRAADITHQMLAYSGKGRFEIRAVRLNDIITDNAQMLRSAIAKSVNLCLNLAPTISAVRADAGQIQQIVMNLITNAAEAIAPETGVVTLTTGERDFAAEELAASRLEEKPASGRFVWMEVRDTGCGMDALTQQRLFEPFFTTKFTGRGLGLAAVLGIVRGHAGAIFVESALGAGSTVRVLLPVPAAAAVESTAPVRRGVPKSSADASLPHGRCVLIVDDEELLRDLCGSIVERHGWRAQLASGGMEAQEIYSRDWRAIACVLLDLTMPPPDGVATFEKIMQINPAARVIICSGYGEEEALRRFQRCRPYAFIQKPYQMAELVHWLSVLEAEDAGPPPTPMLA